jgi:hypothetical protein
MTTKVTKSQKIESDGTKERSDTIISEKQDLEKPTNEKDSSENNGEEGNDKKDNLCKSKETNNFTDFNILENFRNEIQTEHTLISHRMSWYVTSQSFLVAAYAISFNQGHEGFHFFSLALPILGGILSIGAGLSIFSAIWVQNDVINEQTKYINVLKENYRNKENCENKENCKNKDLARLEWYEKVTCSQRPTGKLFHWVAMIIPQAIPLLITFGWILAWFYAKPLPVK